MGDTEAMRQALERIADGQCRADDLRHCGCLLNVQIAKEALAALASTEAPEPEDHVRCDLPTCRICDALAPVGERVPEGWRVEWGHSICTYPGCEGGELVNHRPPHHVTDMYPTVVVCPRCLGPATRPGGPIPRLVRDTPHEGEPE